MKKLKMIVSSAVVLAIVGSAFAFKEKKFAVWCVSANTSSTDCSQTLAASYRTTTPPNNRNYFPGWLGRSTAECIDLTTECNSSGRFLPE